AKPKYVVKFNNESEINKEKIKINTDIFCVKDFAKYVFTQPLRQLKGCDASNLYDEEVNESKNFIREIHEITKKTNRPCNE
ncbi:6078_t:CDS:2, partial [Entrophospora sp. SA101]